MFTNIENSGLWDRLVNLAQVKYLIPEERRRDVWEGRPEPALFMFQRFFVGNRKFLSALPPARG